MIPITCDKKSETPIYRQIVRQFRDAVGAGILRGDERLPTTRALASTLGVNRLTIGRAYAELAKAGIISSHVGRGTFVKGARHSAAGAAAPAGARLPWATLFARSAQRAVEAGLPAAALGASEPGVISFASLFPDPALFPTEPFRRALDEVLRREGHRVLGYGPPAGHPGLRDMIARNLRSRGMRVPIEEIVITNGSQQGIDLVARALLDPGDVVLVENPTYTGAVQVFHSYGATLVGVPVDHDGVIVPVLEEAVARHRPKLIYLMPNFQNPTSETMSLPRRRALVALAASRGVPVLEDDFGGDLRFEGQDLPSLKALDGHQSVIYLSTFAKKLLPGIRIGWIAAPPDVAERLTGLKKIADYSTSLLLQAALYEFCGRGDLERHLTGIVEKYRERRDAMLSAMERCFPAPVTWSRPHGGLAVWVTLPAGVDATVVASRAEDRKVLVGRGDLFYVNGGTNQNLRLTFSLVTPREIARGIRVLGDIITQEIKSRRAAPRPPDAESLPLI
ncbi:MAG TPA: PLP-dependent aminotransferase family protein [Candidatus Polarisedimenticolia bacterium]|nr:PLP-dependent aminotransferase family protein [Candidatus Polarisedimenticolia bacterium]